MTPPQPEPCTAGQESVWDYPRPAICQPNHRHLLIRHQGALIAETREGFRTVETSHPPTYYFPLSAVATALLKPNRRRSFCEWKGEAVYFDLVMEGQRVPDVAWSYPQPTAPFAAIAGHFAFYPAPFDTVLVDGEPVRPQPGGFYGGWITPDIAGPFKGVPGSRWW